MFDIYIKVNLENVFHGFYTPITFRIHCDYQYNNFIRDSIAMQRKVRNRDNVYSLFKSRGKYIYDIV